jgi:hypothetical protein
LTFLKSSSSISLGEKKQKLTLTIQHSMSP